MRVLVLTLAATCALASCNVGKTSVLFATKTSIAVDLDSAPPTVDIGFARKEGSLAPTVDGQVLPLMSGIGGNGGLTNAVFGAGASTNFAVGTPAEIVSKYLGSETEQPGRDSDNVLGDLVEGPPASIAKRDGSKARRYFFGTDTVLGFKVNLAPELNGIPDAAVLGWRRKEVALVPVQQVRKDDGSTELRVASLLATSDFQASADGGSAQAGFSQFYATGLAANHLSAVPFIRNVVAKRIMGDQEISDELARIEANQRVLDDAHKDGVQLHARAEELIGDLPANQLDLARTELAGAGLIDLSDGFADDDGDGTISAAEKRAFLIEFSKVGNDPDEVESLREFVRRLESLARR